MLQVAIKSICLDTVLSTKKVDTDHPDKTLSGAVFELQNASGKVLQSNLTTDANGLIKVSDLDQGDYQFVETKAPDGYQLDQKPVQFSITAGQLAASVTAKDVVKPVPATKGSVTLKKVDTDHPDKTLSGAVFELQNASGKVLQSNLTTDANGLIKVSDLDQGDYQFVETKAPEGYQLDQKPVQFSITAGQLTANVTAYDSAASVYPGQPTTPTHPVQPNQPNKPASPSSPSDSLTVPAPSAKPLINHGEKGAHMTTQPAGHTNSKKSSASEAIKVTTTPGVSNTKGNGKLPSTGDTNDIFAIALGIILLVSGGIIFFINRRRSKTN